MNSYEIQLICSFCGAFTILGTVQAEDAFDAKHEAIRRWPDARYEEMIARLCTLSDPTPVLVEKSQPEYFVI